MVLLQNVFEIKFIEIILDVYLYALKTFYLTWAIHHFEFKNLSCNYLEHSFDYIKHI